MNKQIKYGQPQTPTDKSSKQPTQEEIKRVGEPVAKSNAQKRANKSS